LAARLRESRYADELQSTSRKQLNKNDFYRYCRLVHGWLSAFAFVALCFFSFTGLLLNHPDWLSGSLASASEKFALTQDEVQQLRNAPQPSEVLVSLVAKRVRLEGKIGEGDADGNVVGNELYVRMRGVRGTSFLHADLRSGAVDVTVETTSVLAALNELHRAERAGDGWRFAVDAIAIVLIAMSLVGYLIFLSLRGARLRTAILLTFGSTVGLFLIFVYTVS